MVNFGLFGWVAGFVVVGGCWVAFLDGWFVGVRGFERFFSLVFGFVLVGLLAVSIFRSWAGVVCDSLWGSKIIGPVGVVRLRASEPDFLNHVLSLFFSRALAVCTQLYLFIPLPCTTYL